MALLNKKINLGTVRKIQNNTIEKNKIQNQILKIINKNTFEINKNPIKLSV